MLICALALGVIWAPFAADAQPAGKMYRIGWLGSAPLTTPEVRRLWEAFVQRLRELGYVEGKNILIER